MTQHCTPMPAYDFSDEKRFPLWNLIKKELSMAKKTAEDTEAAHALPPEVPAVPLAEDTTKEKITLAVVGPNDHDGNFAASEAAKYLSRLGVHARFAIDHDSDSRSLVVVL